jgi:hypothetical protein
MDGSAGGAAASLLAECEDALADATLLTGRNARAVAALDRAAARLAKLIRQHEPGWPPVADDELADPAANDG